MDIDVFTLFPEAFEWFAGQRHVRNAAERGLALDYVSYRDHTPLSGGQVDDTPFGGGAGMVLRVDVVDAALRARYGRDPVELHGQRRIVALTPGGRLLNDELASELAEERALTLLCGRYEGFDERIVEHLATDAVSIGRYSAAVARKLFLVEDELLFAQRLRAAAARLGVPVQPWRFMRAILEHVLEPGLGYLALAEDAHGEPLAAALFSVDVAAPITSLPVVRVSNMVRPAPISRAGTGLARAESLKAFRIDRPLSLTSAIASPERADGATPSRSWPSVSARPMRAASASRCNWALDVMTGSP